MDYRVGRPGPLWEGGSVVPKGGIINLVNENAEEGGGLVSGVRLKLRVDIDDEGGGDGGKQTRLSAQLARVH